MVEHRLQIPSGKKAGSYPKAAESRGSEESKPPVAVPVTKALHSVHSQDPHLIMFMSPTPRVRVRPSKLNSIHDALPNMSVMIEMNKQCNLTVSSNSLRFRRE